MLEKDADFRLIRQRIESQRYCVVKGNVSLILPCQPDGVISPCVRITSYAATVTADPAFNDPTLVPPLAGPSSSFFPSGFFFRHSGQSRDRL